MIEIAGGVDAGGYDQIVPMGRIGEPSEVGMFPVRCLRGGFEPNVSRRRAGRFPTVRSSLVCLGRVLLVRWWMDERATRGDGVGVEKFWIGRIEVPRTLQ